MHPTGGGPRAGPGQRSRRPRGPCQTGARQEEDAPPPNIITFHPVQYVLYKIPVYKYVELWYFTKDGCFKAMQKAHLQSITCRSEVAQIFISPTQVVSQKNTHPPQGTEATQQINTWIANSFWGVPTPCQPRNHVNHIQPQALHSFIPNQDGISPPLLEGLSLDWHCSLLTSSHWNSKAISLLSLNFYNNLKGGVYWDVIFDTQTMSLQAIRKLCEQKLVRMYQAHRMQARINIAAADEWTQVMAQIAVKEEKHWKGDRMIARHHGVCYPFKCCLLFCLTLLDVKTLTRRKKIASQNRSRDPEKWNAIHKIINTFGVEGISGDKTDCPPALKPKALQHLELPWINCGISCLFQSVETYESAHRMKNMLEQIRNSSLKHYWKAGRKEAKPAPVLGLPHNWYNDDWFQGLTIGACLMLSGWKDITIPGLVHKFNVYHIQFPIHALHRSLTEEPYHNLSVALSRDHWTAHLVDS